MNKLSFKIDRDSAKNKSIKKILMTTNLTLNHLTNTLKHLTNHGNQSISMLYNMNQEV